MPIRARARRPPRMADWKSVESTTPAVPALCAAAYARGNLARDLGLADHEGVQPADDAEQVLGRRPPVVAEHAACQVGAGEPRALGENVHETRGESPKGSPASPSSRLRRSSRGIDLGAVAGGEDDAFAEALPARTAGGEMPAARGAGPSAGMERRSRTSSGAPLMADPDAGNRGNKWGGGAHFGSVSPRQRALDRGSACQASTRPVTS